MANHIKINIQGYPITVPEKKTKAILYVINNCILATPKSLPI